MIVRYTVDDGDSAPIVPGRHGNAPIRRFKGLFAPAKPGLFVTIRVSKPVGVIMFIHDIVRICGNCVAGMLLMLILAPVGTSQTTSAQEIENVTSGKSVGELRKETESAEKDLFSIFNDINSDDDYDVRCKRVKSLGSRRKEQVCTPKFARRMESNASADMVGQGRWDAPSQPGSRFQEKKDQMRAEMTELLATNTEFSAAFTKFAAAKRAYETKLHSK